MKRLTLILLTIIPNMLWAQKLSVRPTFAYSASNMTFGSSSSGNYNYGGGSNYASPGVDLEWKLKPMKLKKFSALYKIHNTSHKSIMTGMYYVENHYSVYGFSVANDYLTSGFDSRYIHVPLIYKWNFQPFIMNEDLHVSGGLGMMNSFLLNAQLKETSTHYTLDATNHVIGRTVTSAEADVTSFSVSYYWSISIDLSVSFKRLYMGERAYFGFQDQYMKGLQANWNLDPTNSIYMGSYKTWSSLTYGGGFFYIGWKIN
jgi:hypothetical protein